MSDPITSAEPSQMDAWLDEANAIHDATPEPGLALLRRIVPAELRPARRPLYAFLMNHVPGEKFGRWDEALAAQQAVVDATRADMSPVLWRHAAVAARLARDEARATAWRDALARAVDAPPEQAQALVALAAASLTAPSQDAGAAGRTALDALGPLVGAKTAPGLDASFAAVANNLGSHLAERPLADLRQPELRVALEVAAELALQFWQRAGQWLQQERAHYLCAMACNALGDAAGAVQHARAALALIDANDHTNAETVDRAFIELELSQALRLAAEEGAAAATARAERLAAGFEAEDLRTWFADRRARNAALLAHYARESA